jgi:hypothetical protein
VFTKKMCQNHYVLLLKVAKVIVGIDKMSVTLAKYLPTSTVNRSKSWQMQSMNG